MSKLKPSKADYNRKARTMLPTQVYNLLLPMFLPTPTGEYISAGNLLLLTMMQWKAYN